MRVLFLTSGRQVPSSRFRVLQYLPYLAERGHECVVASSRPEKYSSYRWLGHRLSGVLRRRRRWRDLRVAERGQFDVVFLERELFSDDTFDLEREFGNVAQALVWDIDDGLFVLHPQKFDHLARMCGAAIAGNRFLHDRIKPHNPNVTTVPTSVDLARYTLLPDDCWDEKRGRQQTVLGWTGTAANIEYLKLIREPLQELSKRHPIQLRVIAERRRPLRRINLRGVDVNFVRWREESEIDDLRRFDIGLMPMPNTEWTRYKCGLKIIQYMALAIPAVASPVGVNSEIIHHGNSGYLPESSTQWLDILTQLVERPEQRLEIGRAGRQTVESRYSVQGNVGKLVTAFEEAVR